MGTVIMPLKTKEQLAVAKVLKVDFKIDESPYDPDFVTEVLKGETVKKSGKKGLRLDIENLWK